MKTLNHQALPSLRDSAFLPSSFLQCISEPGALSGSQRSLQTMASGLTAGLLIQDLISFPVSTVSKLVLLLHQGNLRRDLQIDQPAQTPVNLKEGGCLGAWQDFADDGCVLDAQLRDPDSASSVLEHPSASRNFASIP